MQIQTQKSRLQCELLLVLFIYLPSITFRQNEEAQEGRERIQHALKMLVDSSNFLYLFRLASNFELRGPHPDQLAIAHHQIYKTPGDGV